MAAPMATTGYAIVGAALGLRLVYLVAVYSGDSSLMQIDSQMWLAFAADKSLWFGNHERMPVYPLYVGLMREFFGPDPLLPVLGQIVLDAGTCWLIAKLAGAVDPRLELPAGLLAAINPTQIVMACLLLGDSFFVFFVAGTLLAAVRWLAAPSAAKAAIFGLWAAFALFNRSLVWPLLALTPFAMLAAAWLLRGTAPLRAAGQAAIFAAIVGAFAGTIVLRNWSDYGAAALTSQAGNFAAMWVVPMARQAKDGTPFLEGQDKVYRAMLDKDPNFLKRDPFDQSREWAAMAKADMAELGWRPIVSAWAAGIAINLFSPAILMSPPVMALPRTGYYGTPGDGLAEKMWNFVFANDNAAYARWLAGGIAIDVPLKLLAIAGLVLGLANARLRWPVLLLAGWVAFVLLVSGPVASAKYRLPIEPATIVFAVLFLMRHRLAPKR